MLICFGVALAVGMVGEVTRFYTYSDLPMAAQLVLVGLLVAAAAAMCLGGLLTVVVRCKAHTLWRNTLVWRFCSWLWNLCREAVLALPLVWKGGDRRAGVYDVHHSVFQLLRRAVGCWAAGYASHSWGFGPSSGRRCVGAPRRSLAAIPSTTSTPAGCSPDLKKHADELNNLGQAISAAVEDRMKSEHFKAELITNVSHDLKTPLTSIINYVDLLKKEPIDNPKALEYIEVLDRKSQRLKKLTEDLVEASKASTRQPYRSPGTSGPDQLASRPWPNMRTGWRPKGWRW